MSYHPIFDHALSGFLPKEPLAMREPIAQEGYACPNCNEPIHHQGCTLPESLQMLFPLYDRDLWCDRNCLTEWIQDNASRIARDGSVREVTP